MQLINAEDFHAAAAQVGSDAVEQEHGIQEDAIFQFIDGSVFHGAPIEPVSMAWGIVIGVRAAINQRDDVLEWLRSRLFDEHYSREERLVVVRLIEEYKATKQGA
jgi:hypothetical protein